MRILFMSLIFLSFFLLIGCESSQLQEDSENTSQNHDIVRPGSQLTDSIIGRPLFNRSLYPDDEIGGAQNPQTPPVIVNPANNQSVFITLSEHSSQFAFPIGWSFGDIYPVITKDDLPLLRPAAIQTGDNRFRGYRQFLTFDFEDGPTNTTNTGNVTFIVDDSKSDKYIGSALFFEEDHPYFAYTLALNDRAFFEPALIGSDVLLLGSEYRIIEATNFSLRLNGIDVSQYFDIRNNDRLRTNKKIISDSMVYYDGYDFTYELRARDLDDDGFYLREGESLRDKLAEERREDIFGNYFDLRYDGLETFVGSTLEFVARDERIDVLLDDIRIPLFGLSENGTLQYGSDEKIHFVECANRSDACIREDDIIVLQGVDRGDVKTQMLRVSGIDEQEHKITFRDVQTSERVSIDYIGGSRFEPPHALLPFFNRDYLVYAINETITLDNGSQRNITNGLAIDLNGDGAIRKSKVPIMQETLRIDISDIRNGSLFLNITSNKGLQNPSSSFVAKQQRFSNGVIDREFLQLRLDSHPFRIVVVQRNVTKNALWDQTLLLDSDEDMSYGLSPFGSEITMRLNSQDTQSTTKNLILAIPYEQRLALVSMGTLTH